ncbi:MAG: hydroxymethylglutaryl-CoA reductase, degradative [Saprospiraceae bacterium]|nr:hydroxymethylglutaryl-CoA reductase, degradative [Saprospiraceae bacterium]
MTQQKDKTITGFSKLSKRGKIKWIVENFFQHPETVMRELKSYWLANEDHQKILDGISENTISNYHLPYGVAPNFVINGKTYAVPMVTEESSVVAAASSASKFWLSRGGIHAEVIGTVKLGQVHFFFRGKKSTIVGCLPALREYLHEHTQDLTANMRKRGGGVLDIQLKDFTHQMPDYYQLLVSFETCDSMGANFINSVLERYAQSLGHFFHEVLGVPEDQVEVLMSILSNYTPDSLVRAWVECPVEELGEFKGGIGPREFATRFCHAVRIAEIDTYRAATHNKGIFNGIDAVVIATGNDFRAIEACGHAYAVRDGQYRSLSGCEVKEGIFRFWLEVPLAVGTVGGLTSLHPIAKRSFELLGNPTASELMMIIGAVGLAQNFSALRSLVTTGIQDGHMRMHLSNILVKLNASAEEADATRAHFADKQVSYQAVRDYLMTLREPATKGQIQTP